MVVCASCVRHLSVHDVWELFVKHQLEKMVCTCEIPDAMLERPSLQDCVAGIPFDVSSATVELCCSTVTQYKDTLN